MHVEAMRWSGLSAADYARARRLGPENLRKWGRRLEAEPLGIDWRAPAASSMAAPTEELWRRWRPKARKRKTAPASSPPHRRRPHLVHRRFPSRVLHQAMGLQR